MKKLLLVGALAIFGAANAQTEKGGWVIGGSTGLGFNNLTTKVKYDSESYDGPKVNTISFSPTVGYFVMNDLAVGLDLGVLSALIKQDDYKDTHTVFYVLPAAAYYFKAAQNVRPYLGAGVGYASYSNKESENGHSYTDKYDGFAWKAKGGALFLINNNIGIDLGVSYGQLNNTQDDKYDGKTKTTVGDLGVNVGFSLFLR